MKGMVKPISRSASPFTFVLAALFGLSCCGVPNADEGSGAWVKYAGNPVLSPDHAAADNYDHYTVGDCCVLKDGDTYKMWYTAGGFTPPDTVNHCSIAYATSPDGISWTKHAGNPVLNNDAAAWDRYAVETVSVLIDQDAPPEGRYMMWYAGRTKEYGAGGPAYDFGLATSADGIAWTKHAGPVLVRGGSSDWDNSFVEGPAVIKDGPTFKMWYAGFDAVANGQETDGKVSIGYATSSDGAAWTKHPGNPVIVVGAAGAWDGKTVQDPHVIKLGGTYHMWYGGTNYDFAKFGQQTGYAHSPDGIAWIKSPRNPVLRRGGPGAWDANTASFGSVLIEGDIAKMWYTGRDKDDPTSLPYFWDIGYAERPIVGGTVEE